MPRTNKPVCQLYSLAFKASGIPIAPGKTVGPTQGIELLGILLDSLRMQARLPVDKVQKIISELSQWSSRKSATLKELHRSP